MDESSSSGTNLTNSLPSKVTSTTIHNVNVSFEKDYPLTEKFQKQIIKSIARILREIIKDNILNNQMKFLQQDILYYQNIPNISLEDYIYRIYKNTKMNLSTLIISIIYIDRFCENNKYVISMNNIHNLLLTCCLLSLKYNEDKNISSKYYAYVAGVSVITLNNLEFFLCIKLNHCFFVEQELYQKYFDYFSKNIKK